MDGDYTGCRDGKMDGEEGGSVSGSTPALPDANAGEMNPATSDNTAVNSSVGEKAMEGKVTAETLGAKPRPVRPLFLVRKPKR